MKERLSLIFDFLQKNRSFNTQVQKGFYRDTLLPYQEASGKLRSLFWQVQRTQSQPNLSNISKFWMNIQDKDLSSFASLLSTLGSDSKEQTYSNLFNTLLEQPSWGGKTSALFVKSLYHVHTDERYKRFSFLNDAPSQLLKGDRLFLPVDQVIINIFRMITKRKHLDFRNINKFLEDYTGKKMEVWDDLWFWGFITQKGTGNKRKFIWNEEKYWSLQHTPKDEESLQKVEEKAKAFLQILQL